MLLFDNFVNTVYFNPLPRKEGDRAYTQGKKHHRNFNPLPRKEGDEKTFMQLLKAMFISIHSLVKRET